MDVDDELVALCRACGLCCDEALFGRVTLETDEVDVARRRGLRVVPGGGAFEQPCSALRAGRSGFTCEVYDARPRACRAFACRLHERHRREGGPLEARLEAVRRVRALLAQVEGAHGSEAVEELRALLDADFARA